MTRTTTAHNLEQSLKLIDYLRGNLAGLENKSYDEAAEMAQAALGFSISTANIAHVCKSAKITWPAPMARLRGERRKNDNDEIVDDLLDRVNKLERLITDNTHSHNAQIAHLEQQIADNTRTHNAEIQQKNEHFKALAEQNLELHDCLGAVSSESAMTACKVAAICESLGLELEHEVGIITPPGNTAEH